MIIKILSDSKQILWQEQWDLTKYETNVIIDEIEYIVYAIASTRGSEVCIYNPISNKEIYNGDLFDLVNGFWHCDTTIFEGGGKTGEVFLFDGYEIFPIQYFNYDSDFVYNKDLNDFSKLAELIKTDPNAIKYLDKYLNEKEFLEGDLDLWELKEIPDLLKNIFSKQRGKLNLSSVEILSDEEALALSKHRGELILCGLRSIEEVVVDRLSKHSGILDLSGLEEISDISAKYLSNYEGILSLESLHTFSETAISSLLESKGIIICQGQLYNEYRKKYADSIRSEKICLDESNLSISYFSIVPQLGICIDFIKNIDNKIYVVFDRKSKISISDFLLAFGFSILDILYLFNVSFIQIRNNREALEKELGQKFATKIYRRWVEDFVDEDTEEVFSLERSEEIFNINEKLTEDSIQNLIELPIEYIYLQSDTSINFDLYLKSCVIGRATNIIEAQQLLYRSMLNKDADDNQTAEEFAKSYSDGQAINLGPEARKKLNEILSITTPRANGLYLEDYIQIMKYLISN
jgi:hypothetical protein